MVQVTSADSVPSGENAGIGAGAGVGSGVVGVVGAGCCGLGDSKKFIRSVNRASG